MHLYSSEEQIQEFGHDLIFGPHKRQPSGRQATGCNYLLGGGIVIADKPWADNCTQYIDTRHLPQFRNLEISQSRYLFFRNEAKLPPNAAEHATRAAQEQSRKSII